MKILQLLLILSASFVFGCGEDDEGGSALTGDEVTFSRLFEEDLDLKGTNVLQVGNEDFLFASISRDSPTSLGIRIHRLNFQGEYVWDRWYQLPGGNEETVKLLPAGNRNYLVVANVAGERTAAFLIDEGGEVIWFKQDIGIGLVIDGIVHEGAAYLVGTRETVSGVTWKVDMQNGTVIEYNPSQNNHFLFAGIRVDTNGNLVGVSAARNFMTGGASLGLVQFNRAGRAESVVMEDFGDVIVPTSFVKNNNGGFAVTGIVENLDGSDGAFIGLINQDFQLSELVEHNLGLNVFPNSICTNGVRGYAVAGYQTVSESYTKHVMFGFDREGQLEWQAERGTTGLNSGSEIIQTFDGGLAVAGCTSESGSVTAQLLKTNYMGEVNP